MSAMPQWWLSNVSYIGRLSLVQSIPTHVLQPDRPTPWGLVCPRRVAFVPVSTGSFHSTDMNAEGKSAQEQRVWRSPRLASDNVWICQSFSVSEASSFVKPLCSPYVLPVVPLHQSAVLLNMSIRISRDFVSPAARPACLCSAAVWRFKDLGLVLRHMFWILPKSDRLCHQICKHWCTVKWLHGQTVR